MRMAQMSVDLKLLDQFRLSEHLTKNFACGFSEDNRLFIISNAGVYIISFIGDVSNSFKNFLCKKYLLTISDYGPCTSVGLDINSFLKECERKDLYETVMSTEYSVDLKHAKPVDPLPVAADWSPLGIMKQHGCLLAVATNLYNLEIYAKTLNKNGLLEYKCLVNVPKKIIEEESKTWTDPTRFKIDRKLTELKRRVDSVAPSAFAWTHAFEVDGLLTCCLIVGHLNGSISFLRISSKHSDNITVEYQGKHKTQLGRISTLRWHSSSKYGGGLFYADSEGRMNVLHVIDLDKKGIHIDKDLSFWTEQDKISVDKITIMSYDNCTYILLAKQHALVIYAIDKYGEIFDNKIVHIDGYFITGIHHWGNIILVLSLSGVLTQLTINQNDNKIDITEEKISLRMNMSRYRTHGFCVSNNNALFFLLSYPWGLDRNDKQGLVHVFVYQNTVVKPLDVLWNNKNEKLSYYLDCFESLRLTCMLETRFPWLGLPCDLNHDDLNLTQLKTLRLIAKMSEMVFEFIPIVKKYDIKPYIIYHYLVEIKLVIRRLKKLFRLKNSGKELTVFQMQSIDIQNFFLKEMVIKNILAKANVGKKFVAEMTRVIEIANELKYPDMMQCVWCGEKIIGPSCLPPHADSRCSVSMMPIFLVPSYKCPCCKCLVHKEIEKEEPILECPYCDTLLEILPIDNTKYEQVAKNYGIDASGIVSSACFEDCLNKEEQSMSDIDENCNDCEYVIFSDSDDDESDDGEKIRTLYFRLSKLSLGEIIDTERSHPPSDEAGPSKMLKLCES